jgi:hypothetical protein
MYMDIVFEFLFIEKGKESDILPYVIEFIQGVIQELTCYSPDHQNEDYNSFCDSQKNKMIMINKLKVCLSCEKLLKKKVTSDISNLRRLMYDRISSKEDVVLNEFIELAMFSSIIDRHRLVSYIDKKRVVPNKRIQLLLSSSTATK